LLSISAIILAALVVAAGDGGSGTYVAADHDYDVAATPPAWSSPPTCVVYRWRRCTGSRCVAIAHGLVLALKRSGTYRLVATATIAGQTVATTSRALRYR